jgi:hypothetical protein
LSGVTTVTSDRPEIGTAMLAEPLKLTPAIVRAVVNVAADVAVAALPVHEAEEPVVL